MRVWIFYILNNKLQCNEIEFSVSRSFISSSLVIVLQSTLKPFFCSVVIYYPWHPAHCTGTFIIFYYIFYSNCCFIIQISLY